MLAFLCGHMLHADNDSADIIRSVAMIHTALPAIHTHDFPGYGHFCYGDLGTDVFPELRAVALGLYGQAAQDK